MALLPTQPIQQAASTVAGFSLPTASSGSVPAGSEGGVKTLAAPVQGMAGATGIGGSGPATTPAVPATTAAQPTPGKPPQSFVSSLGLGKNPNGPGVPTASGQTLKPTTLPGDSRTAAEKDLARQQTISTLQPMTLIQQGEQAKLAQNAAVAGLSPEVTAGMQQMALMNASQDARTKIAAIDNNSYGNAVSRMDAESKRQAQQQADSIDALLTTNVGTANWQATLDTALALYPDNAYYQAIAKDPSILKVLGDANVRSIQEANRSASSGVIDRTVTESGNDRQEIEAFGGWRDAEFSGINNLLESQAKLYTWDDFNNQQDISEYERLFGTKLDPNSEVDRETATAWSQYQDALKLKTATIVQGEMVQQLANSGVAVTPEMLDRLQGISGDLSEMMSGPAKLGDISAMWDGDLTNGRFSTYFTGWDGRDISDTGQSKDQLSVNLDTLWKEYVKQNPTGDLLSRNEFRDLMGATAPDVAVSSMGSSDAAAILAEAGLGKLSQAQLAQAAPTSLTVEQAASMALGGDAVGGDTWWQNNSSTWQEMPHLPYSAYGGIAPKIKEAYAYKEGKPSGWSTEGTLFTGEDGHKYRVARSDGVITNVGENTIGVFVPVQDLENPGTIKYVQIGKHKKGS